MRLSGAVVLCTCFKDPELPTKIASLPVIRVSVGIVDPERLAVRAIALFYNVPRWLKHCGVDITSHEDIAHSVDPTNIIRIVCGKRHTLAKWEQALPSRIVVSSAQLGENITLCSASRNSRTNRSLRPCRTCWTLDALNTLGTYVTLRTLRTNVAYDTLWSLNTLLA